jgi:deoxyribonuclease-4
MTKKYFGININNNIEELRNTINVISDKHINTVQLMFDSKDKEYNNYYKYFKNFIKKKNILCVIHASYTINLANNWDEYNVSVHKFIDEIKLSYKIGAKYIVVHLGKQLNLSKEEAYNNMYTSFIYIHNQTLKEKNLKILIETSTGQGSELCYKLEDFAYFYKKISKNKNKDFSNRFGICIDTCHIFAAGYDLNSKNKINMYLEAFEELIGLKHVKLIHLNNAKKGVGSKLDRHENINKGKIQKKYLLYFAKYFFKFNVPIILETPYNNILNDYKLIKKYFYSNDKHKTS